MLSKRKILSKELKEFFIYAERERELYYIHLFQLSNNYTINSPVICTDSLVQVISSRMNVTRVTYLNHNQRGLEQNTDYLRLVCANRNSLFNPASVPCTSIEINE